MMTSTDRFTKINGAGLSNHVPWSQKDKVKALKDKHYPLFYSYSQKFAILLKKLEPK